MLEELDDIQWSELTHAYGDASDVPPLIRALALGTKAERDKAIYELFGNIWHQGTVYSATSVAIPFLYELLQSPGTLDRTGIAHLLACIADGNGYLDVNAWGELRKAWTEILARKGRSLAEALAKEAEEVALCRSASSQFLPLLVPFLRADEPEIRRSVAVALGHYPEHTATSLAALQAAGGCEEDEEVMASIEESIAELMRSAH